MLTKRIASVRPGDQIHVGIGMPKGTSAKPDLSDIITAVYSASDGSLVRVLNKSLARQTTFPHCTAPIGSHNVPLCISTSDLCARKPFELYKLALIVPEMDPSGARTRYSVATMIFAYDNTG
ncbi:hypothetical protein GGI23_006430 [Coemansia sp. RSA 2559]|nr:hypothetical protein GGI23_006430 [Coemansia sp. RSA 2559]